ncbi:MAG TPA: response regulator [Candidatus Binatia bacterium]|nr:response regulator [Candidatus Binatia bacterium]
MTRSAPTQTLGLVHDFCVKVRRQSARAFLFRLILNPLVSQFDLDIVKAMILLVEDDVPSRYAFARLLRKQGYEVIEAGDANEAVALLDGLPVELVITDMVLPKLNGLHLVSLIHARWPGIPIVLMSSYLSESAGKIILAGSADFFQKPIRPSALVRTVQRLLPKSKAQLTAVASSTYEVYRRKPESEVWHFCRNCSQWPAEDYIEQRHLRSTDEVCSECIVKWRTANFH